jgi:succinoglycan biosynthesis protein ExoM
VTPHICVCICTFKRPALLEQLLRSLKGQRTDGRFTYSALVVDNDQAESARAAVAAVAPTLGYPIAYFTEPRQNIALARNKAVLNAVGDYISTIDDDEVASPEWLHRMFAIIEELKADGALGPVLPSFSPDAPRWLKRSGLCDRPGYPTGKILTAKDRTRTGNTVLHRRIFNDGKSLFDERYGRSGGEDTDFFTKRIAEGFKFVWCQEAEVFEEVPPERCTLSFHLKKFIRVGALTGQKMRRGTAPLWIELFKSAAVTFLYIPVIPLLALRGRSVLAPHLARYLYHVSRLLGTAGIILIREK